MLHLEIIVWIAVLLYMYWIQIFRNQQKKFQYYFEMQLHNFCYLLSVLTNLFKNHQNFNILLCSRFSGEIVSLSPLITLPPLPPIRPCCRNSSSVFAPNRLWHNLTRVSSWVSGWINTKVLDSVTYSRRHRGLDQNLCKVMPGVILDLKTDSRMNQNILKWW